MGNSSNPQEFVNESFEVRLIRKSPTAKFQSLYLIREKRSYLHNPEYVGQVIRRKGNVRIIMTGEFFFVISYVMFLASKIVAIKVCTSSSQSTFDSYYFSKVFDGLKCQVS